jgi:hypothetical protein
MTCEEYACFRKSIGTLEYVGQLLGKSKSVMSRRESGESAIDLEAEIAIRALAARESGHKAAHRREGKVRG